MTHHSTFILSLHLPKPARRIVVLGAALSVAAMNATGALAQEITADVEQVGSTILLERIIVSNRFWQEDVFKIPGSVTTIAKDEIDEAVNRDLSLVTRKTPNTVFQSSNSDTRLVVRGIVSYPNALSDPLGISINEVALPLGSIQAPTFLNIEEVTLFKGAQGAHFGRSSEAGLLRIGTSEPGEDELTWIETGTSMWSGGESVPTYVGQAGFSKQISDSFAATSAIEVESTKGLITNPLKALEDGGELKRVTWQGGIKLDVSDQTSLQFDSIVEKKEMGKEQFRYNTGLFATDRFVSNYSDRSAETRETAIHSLRIKSSFDNFDVTAISGLTQFDREFSLDFDTSPLMLGTTELDIEDVAVSQEIRFNSNLGDAQYDQGMFNWSFGAYVSRQNTDVEFNLKGLGVNRETKIRQTNAAVFGFTEYSVTDRFRIGGGARLDYLTSEGKQDFSTAMFKNSYGRDLESVTFLPKATASFDLNDNATIYGSFSRGYLAGGYNYNFANSASNFTFAAEHSWTGEIGIRGSLFDESVRFDLAGYYTDIQDKQITETVPGGVQRITNAGEVDVYGFEASLEADITDSWTVNAGIGLQNSSARDFKTMAGFPLPVPVDYSGNALPLAPEITYQFGLKYTDPSGFFAGASVQGSSDYFFDAANMLKQQAFAKVDGELGFKKDNFTLTLWAKNLFDSKTFSQMVSSPRGILVEDSTPREFGLRVKATF